MAGPLAAEDGVVGVAFEPAVRVPRPVLVVMRIAGLGLGRDGVRVELLPLVQLVVHGDGHGVALADLVIAHGRAAVLVDEAVAAEHAGDQPRRMVPPVEQVRAGDVPPVVPALVLEDVEQVVAALPVDGPVGIEGHAASFRGDEVVARPVRVAEQLLAERAGGAVGVARSRRDACGRRVLDAIRYAPLVSRWSRPSAIRASPKSVLVGNSFIRSAARPSSKSHQASGLGSDGWLGFSAAICSASKRDAVDAGVVDRAGEEAVVGIGVDVPQAHQDQAVAAEPLRAVGRVVGVLGCRCDRA